MNVKKIKRKCMVRGCRNTDTFSISNTREMGNTVIICPGCISAALAAIEGYAPTEKAVLPCEPPPLFYNTSASDEKSVVDDGKFICEYCKKECASSSGLKSHMRACEKKVGEDDEN